MTVVGDTLSTRLEKPPCNELECKYYGEISIYTDKNGTQGLRRRHIRVHL